MRRLALISLFLVVVTLAAYWPVRQAEFNNYDDDVYVTDNPQVLHGLTSDGFRWAFTTFHACNWHPLTWLSHMADCSLFGENATGAHWMNVGFHIANTLLLLLLLWQMTGAVWRSAFVAALFALHPLHVESVAWIAERKDVLSTFFAFLTLLAYVGFAQGAKVQDKKSKVWYGLAVVSFVLGLLSKPMLVTIPFVMLLLDYWPLQRLPASVAGPRLNTNRGLKPLLPLIREKLPFFGLAVASSAVTFWAQNTGGAVVTIKEAPLFTRLGNAALAYAAYLRDTFWPAKLVVLYPFVSQLPGWKVTLAVLCLVAATALCLKVASRAPYVAIGWLWFIGTLVPVIGLVLVGSQARADRYTYVPLIGVFVLVTWGAAQLTARWRWQRLALPVLAALILSGCFICTRVQVGYWRDNLTLFSHTLQLTEKNPVAEQVFGFALALQGKETEAIEHFDAALRVWPDYLPARLDRGIAHILGGQPDAAIADFQEALRLNPNSEKAYYQLAGALAYQKQMDEAKANYLHALRCQPEFAEAHSKLGKLLLLQGDKTNAMSHLYQAVKIRPDCAEAQYALGNELAQQRKFSEAAIHLRAAIKAQPNYPSPLNDLAWILATQTDPSIRDVPEAIRLARRACELTANREPGLLSTLGVAQSEAGQFPEAIRATENAITLAMVAHDETTAAGLRQRLEFYRQERPYHTIPQ